ncbi:MULTISPECIES: ComEA family DNA-binding protein [Morganella]|jgi:competence protein ComEA|uniref:ComEA family DNA-binding protein n=1 Tax=Morganella TaxID=581 RepID=UPI00046A4D08|nr:MULTISPECIES: helix-hairpin-helix domain-containing protein [Morganella]ELA9088813.1 helix-hairpin-helix domain-containing protein [Morganella morganii]MCU6209818.1 helix-hairpin-helix domain-containing protein [Morganella morganii]MCU6224349.1 helix-hairpin-helix domain-containing protein [Morganella morganii]MCU6233982.1 helix-hairpin-helix domain-containing protein [Morganella morganii]MCU6235989.1 helix-hairpin-helix domain-containing protein [Morganella morganii]
MKTKWTSALLLTSALLTGGFFSTSALAQAAQPAESTQVQPSVSQENRISINTATAEELARELSGVGPKKAQRIVEYRTENGPFTSAEQLKDVYGIGERIFTMNSDKIAL